MDILQWLEDITIDFAKAGTWLFNAVSIGGIPIRPIYILGATFLTTYIVIKGIKSVIS